VHTICGSGGFAPREEVVNGSAANDQAQAQGRVTVTLVCPDSTSTLIGPLVPVLWVPTAVNDLRQTYPLPATGLTLTHSATEKLSYPFPFSSISTVDVTMDWELKGVGPTLAILAPTCTSAYRSPDIRYGRTGSTPDCYPS
jgi:hypothetical protein